MTDTDDKLSPHDAVVGALNRARDIIDKMVVDPQKAHDADLLWESYSEVELSIGIAKFLYPPKREEVGTFREIAVSKNNDPQSMAIEKLITHLSEIRSELEFAQYNMESGRSNEGLQSARKARDTLKMLLLAHRKARRASLVKKGRWDSGSKSLTKDP
ncbi:MAG TPA: hypothetical protein VFF30_13065 [Nitrososphaerales archaeon]|nr:hypothetical protein [Nitrososphaerales archaeon]